MTQTQINIDKSNISLVYDIENNLLSGDNTFYVTLEDIGDDTIDDFEVTLDVDPLFVLLPSTFTATIGEPQAVTIRLATSEVLPEGNFNFKISANNTYSAEKTINTSIASKTNTTQSDNVYKLTYFIERLNYECKIYEYVSQSTILTPIEINGRCDLKYQDKKDLTDPIVSATLKMRLDASLDLTLEDLYSEEERHFKVELEKEGIIVFSGYILPDGIWSDFVADKWILDITATCGLSTLKNFSFSQENKQNFYGRMTAIDIINNCLQKTGLNLPIYANCQIVYDGWSGHNILSSVYFSTERYFQNKDEPMDCESVLKSLMQIFGATILQFNNAWYIYRAKDMVNNNPLTSTTNNLLFSVFNGSQYVQNVVKTVGDKIGSHINNAEKFHINGNQKITISPSVQAYQISYTFGDAKNVLANGGLVLEGATGINIPGWTVHTSPDGLVDRGVRINYDYGLRSAVRSLNPLPYLLTLNQSISVTTGVKAVLRIKYRNDGFNSLYLNFAFGIQDGGTAKWFNLSNSSWQSSGVINRVDNYHQVVSGGNASNYGNGDAIFELEVVFPMDGDIIIQIFRNGHGPGGLFGVHSVEFFPTSQGNIKSKDYKARILESKSSHLKSGIEVYNGDSESDLFVGTIFKSDSDTPTKYWKRYFIDPTTLAITYFTEQKELLEIISSETLSMNPRPMTAFEGDFKGFINYLNFITIDSFTKPYGFNQVPKLFQFLKWSYSFDDDITKMFCKEIEEQNLDSNLYQVDIYENFGSESKVTIK